MRIIDIRYLITFKAIVQCNSFTKAASELQYSQSTVTSHVKNLEDELGFPLFDRFGKKFVLNEAGRQFYAYTIELVNVYDKMINLQKVIQSEKDIDHYYIQMVYHKNKWISPALHRFIEMVKTHFLTSVS